MTPEDLQKTVALITSTDPKNRQFGTGFVFRSRSATAHLLTCAHVIKAVGGSETVQIEGRKAIVIVTGEEWLDLAVLRVEGWGRKEELKLGEAGEQNSEFLTAGFQEYGNTRLLKSLSGKLENRVESISQKLGERVRGWELNLPGESSLQRGYSGAPIVETKSNQVIGVVSHREGEGKKGLAIDIKELGKIWKHIDSEQLYRKLCQLGYQQQVKLFQRLVSKQNLAALLIYGPPEYGQKWLLNRLLTHYFPGIENSKVVNVSLKRRGRSPSTQVLGRDFHRFFGFENPVTLEEATQAVYQCWQTRNLVLIFHDVD